MESKHDINISSTQYEALSINTSCSLPLRPDKSHRDQEQRHQDGSEEEARHRHRQRPELRTDQIDPVPGGQTEPQQRGHQYPARPSQYHGSGK